MSRAVFLMTIVACIALVLMAGCTNLREVPSDTVAQAVLTARVTPSNLVLQTDFAGAGEDVQKFTCWSGNGIFTALNNGEQIDGRPDDR